MIARLINSVFRKKILLNDLTWTMPVSPVFGLDRGTPVDRYYINKFLAENSCCIQGRVLEIGDSTYTKQFGRNRVTRCDIFHTVPGNPKATLIGDLADSSTLPENMFDCFICTQTFNFIFNVQQAVLGAHQLLKPGGILLATVAGISQISRYDMDRWGDYWRFTTASVEKLFEPVFKGSLKVESHGNVMAAVAFLQGIAVEELPDSALLDQPDPDYQVLISIAAIKG